MRIGVIGSGIVGQTLGAGLAKRGHEVMLGTRDPSADRITSWAKSTASGARAGTFDETARFAQIAILATSWDGTESALRIAGPDNLAGKVVIDATNPLDFSKGAPPTLAVAYPDSAGESVQRWVPKAKVVKAFNTIGNAHMVDPQFSGGPPDFFICGNDDGAKATVGALAKELGWSDPVDLGGIEGSRYLEPMAMAWIAHGFRTNSWGHAFKLLRK